MSHVRSHVLEAQIARRRELEHVRSERNVAVNRYYDHWGKVTNRYINWTRPEYYEQADAKLQENRDKKHKAQRLEERREKLRQLFAEEAELYDQEIREKQKSKARFSRQKAGVDLEVLEKIEQSARERENIKRKLELEAKLYGRWRHGVDDDSLIFESKNDHQVLAKLNWLDKQIENQVQREKEEAEAQERNLRYQEELRKTEELQKEREALRAEELEHIKALQEKHMKELKLHQEESETLKNLEKKLRAQNRDLEKELELLEESTAYIREPVEFAQAYNLKNVKVFIRQRSDTFRNQIKLLINILERIQPYAVQSDTVDALLKKYKQQLETENSALAQFDAMYESEAKYNLLRCEEVWQQQQNERYKEMKQLMSTEQQIVGNQLKQNIERQNEMLELRSAHINSLEAANDKLKQLTASASEIASNAGGGGGGDTLSTSSAFAAANLHRMDSPHGSERSYPNGRLTDSFSKLNLDRCPEAPAFAMPTTRSALGAYRSASQVLADGQDSVRSEPSRAASATPSATDSARPKFGRKRVVWT